MDLSRIERALRRGPPEEPRYQPRTLDERRVAIASAPSRSARDSGPAARRLVALAGAATIVAFLVVLATGMPTAVDGPAASSTPRASVPTSAQSTPTLEPSAMPQDSLAGTWQLEAGVLDGRALALVDNRPVTLVIDDENPGGTAACNLYGAQILVADGEVDARLTSVTEMLCEEPAMVVEEAYFEALPRVSRLSLDGDRLTLSGEGVELRFVPLAAAPVEQIVDQLWLLEAMTFDDGTATGARGQNVTLELRSNGALHGSTGSRTLTGSWITYGAEFRFPDLGAEGDDPPSSLAEQDSHVIGVIEGGVIARVEGDRLILRAPGGNGLVYRLAAASPSTAPAGSAMPTAPPAPDAEGWVGPARISREHYDFARLVVDAEGHAHVAAVNRNGVFYLTNATGGWTTERVSRPIQDGYDGDASIIVNEEGSSTIAFARFSALRCTLRCEPVGSRGIFIVTNESGSWSDAIAVIEGGGQEPSLQASAGRLQLAYSHGDFGARAVYHASQDGVDWVTSEIDEGEAPSLRIGRDGLARIAYVDPQGGPNLAEAQTPVGPFTITRVPGEWAAGSAMLALDAEDDPHVVFSNDVEERGRCGAFHLERTGTGWSNAARLFPDDGFCQVAPESVDSDASGALHVISLYDAAGAGVWYANNTSGQFGARQLREPSVFTDDGPPGVSALDVDSQDRPHVIYGVFEVGAYDEDTEGSPDDDGLWYGIGPAAPTQAAETVRLRIIEAVHADPSSFGGVYLDQDGTLAVQYIGANDRRAAIEHLLAPSVALRWEKVERSHADLMRILRELSDRRLDGVFLISIDTINNQVKVTFDPDVSPDNLSETLATEYGDAVAAEPDTPIVVQPDYPSPPG